MKCPTCESCEYAQYCGATEIMRKCERHNKKVKQTNEEWLKSLNTKDLAKWIRRKTHGNDEYNEEVELAWEAWLKEKHHA